MLVINETPESKVYFTSDLHLGHQRDFVWKARGYYSPKDHTQSIINGINQHVRESDMLFMTGDLCLNSSKEDVDQYLDSIVCKNILCLWGNHNNPHEKSIYNPTKQRIVNDFRVKEAYPIKYKNMTYLGHYFETSVNGQFIVLFHYPLISWNHSGKGSWAIVGHEHGGLTESRPDHTNGKLLDVGWDLYKKPLSFNEVKEIMDKKSVRFTGHHNS